MNGHVHLMNSDSERYFTGKQYKDEASMDKLLEDAIQLRLNMQLYELILSFVTMLFLTNFSQDKMTVFQSGQRGRGQHVRIHCR